MQKQIAKNTLYLYLRQLILLVVSLYTVRIVLEVLGVENYGIYNVIAGFVSIFNIICTNLNITTQRYISYSLGNNDVRIVSECFSNSFALHVLLGLIVIILLETIGIFGFDSLNIPTPKHRAATIVFQISVVTMFLTITQVPYNALVIANEKMNIFAFVSIIEALLKLVLVFTLKHIKADILILYSIMMFGVQFIIMMTYRLYCISRLKEQCRIKIQNLKKATMSEMLKFSGWSFLTSSAWILKSQGVNMVLNIFFGTIVNAARGITNQIVSVVTTFMLNFQMAANPKINQFHARGEFSQMQKLVYESIKLSFFLLLILFVPIWIEIDTILSLWLTDTPEYTSLFIRILIIELLIDSSTGPLATAVRASGKVRRYSLLDFGILIWNVPLCWLAFKMGYSPMYAYIVSLILTTVAVVARHLIVINQLNFSWGTYIKDVLIKEILLFVFGFAIAAILYPVLPYEPIAIQFTAITLIIGTITVACYGIGLTQNERKSVKNLILSKLKR